MTGVVEALHADLVAHLHDDETFGSMLRHPLVMMPMPAPTMNAMANRLYLQKREKVEREERAGNWPIVVHLHERPFRLEALLRYRAEIEAQAFWPLVAEVYGDSENVFEMRDLWLDLLGSAVPHRERLMSEEERTRLATMPETLTLFRGSRAEEPDDDLGLSWTLDRERAEWFAQRFKGHQQGYLHTATVRRDDVVGFLMGREEEFLVLPQHLTLVRVEALVD